jgi:hypothetical protein
LENYHIQPVKIFNPARIVSEIFGKQHYSYFHVHDKA